MDGILERTDAPPAHRGRLQLLGRFRFDWGETGATSLDAPRLQSLFAFLALHRDAAIPRAHVAAALWPDKPDGRARANLRKFLLELRRAVPAFDAIVSDEGQLLRWRPGAPCDIDVDDFERAVADDDLRRALELYCGDLLPSCGDEWIAPHRGRLAQAFTRGASRLIHLLEAKREYGTALAVAERLIARDPLDEPAHRAAMRLRALDGDRAGALRAFDRCATVLRDELGIDPDPDTLQLRDAIAQARPLADRDTTTEGENKLIGRGAEWQCLMQAWDKAAPRKPHCVVIRGEAGIGKSRLAEELRVWASRRSTPSAHARAFAAEGALALAPVADWLRAPALFNHLALLDPRWLSELSRLVPEAADLRPGVAVPRPASEPWQRHQLFESLARAVHGAGRALLLVLDDIQWSDRETIEWLHFLMRFDGPGRLLLVCTERVEEVAEGHPVVEYERALLRDGLATLLDLGPLSAFESAALAARVRGRGLSQAQIEHLYRRTEGNPLFVVEAARSGLEDESPSPTVQAVIDHRLAQLSAQARSVALAGAAIGRAFDFATLHRATAFEEFAALDALDELVRKRIARETHPAGMYDFSHDRIREAAYAALSDARRRVLHRRIAHALCELNADTLDANGGRIARHFELAGLAGDAVAFYLRAAREALRVYAIDECQRLCAHVLTGDLAPQVEAVQACEAGITLTEALRLSGRWSEAEARARAAERRAREAGLVPIAARAQRALADVLRLRGAYAEALSWLDRAREGFEQVADRAGMRQTLWTMGEVYWYMGRNADALRVLAEQFALAEADGDTRSAADALASQGMVHWSMGALDHARASCEQSIAAGESSGNLFAVSRACITQGNIDHTLQRAAAAVAWYARAHEVATRINDLQGAMWGIANISGVLGWLLGDTETALAYVAATLELAFAIGDRWTFCQNLIDAGIYADGLGRNDEAERYFSIGCAMGRRLGMPTYLSNMLVDWADFLLRRGRALEADAVLAESEGLVRNVVGKRVGGGDARFNQAVLRIRVDVASGRRMRGDAVADTLRLAECFGAPEQKATIHYAAWRLDPSQTAERDAAATAYRELMARQPNRVARDRYLELTSERLPLPALGDPLGLRAEFDLEKTLARIDAMVARMQAAVEQK